jgi:hypothetical protein
MRDAKHSATPPAKVKPDTAAAINFLRRFHPSTSWALTAIIPDGKTETVTFDADHAEDAAAWIQKHQGKRNLYFHVNPTRRPLTSKASKADIARLAWLHVDLDPRAGEDLTAERERALKALQAFKPLPTVIIDSGGGFQGFWRLQPSDALEVGGDLAKAAELEAYNIQLERVLGGDHCHDISRIMRLPGTVNVPNAKKRAKGRVPTLAKLVEWNDTTYSIDQFTATVRANVCTPTQRAAVRLGDGVARPCGTAELAAWAQEHGREIPDRVLALVATGADPVEPDKYPSRSEALFATCCGLVRAGVPDELTFAAITDRSNGIAASVRDKPDWQGYARRQIERAREEAISPGLRKLNDKHFVVMADGEQTRVMTTLYDVGAKRDMLVSQSFASLSQYYANQTEVVGNKDGQPVTMPLWKFWNTHPLRRTYEAVYFDPGAKGEGRDVPRQYNLWRGWAVAPQPGDWTLMREHVCKILAAGDPECDAYILRWAAWAVQHPDVQAETALVFRGGRGAGKGLFGRALKDMFGRHGLQVFAPSQVTGKFNAHFLDCCLLFADESIHPGKDGGESQLKGLITEPRLPIEKKGRDIVTAKNRLHIVMASNDRWVVPAGVDERRFAVFDVDDSKRQDKAYFGPLMAELKDGGLAAMLHALLEMDLGDFHPRWSIPQTQALTDQKVASLTGIERVFLDLLRAGELPVQRWRGQGKPFVATERLREYAQYRLKEDVSSVSVADLLKALGFDYNDKSRPRGFDFPALVDARAAWNEKTGMKVKWDSASEWADMPKWTAAPEVTEKTGKTPF